MAKADFCFNFYDGDATRDMAHMNRLERGAYIDVIIQQRQRGHLSIEDIKKFISKDFETVWASLEWVLKKDGEGKFFIEWLENSEVKTKKHSTKQSGNVKIRYQTATKPLPKNDLVIPLGYGDGNEDGIEDKLKGALDEKFISDLQPLWGHVNFEKELESFRSKVLLSPRVYRDHDISGIRLAFQYQLRCAKPVNALGNNNHSKALETLKKIADA
jgi:hypothetical protein